MLPHIDSKYSPLILYPRLLRENSWPLIPDLWLFQTGLCCFLPAILGQAQRSPRASSPAITRGSQIKYSLQGETKTIKLHRFENSPLNISITLCCPIVCRAAGLDDPVTLQGSGPSPGVTQPQAPGRDGPELGELMDSVLRQGSDFSLLIPWVTSVVVSKRSKLRRKGQASLH